MLRFLNSTLHHLREFSLHSTGGAQLQRGPALPLRLGCRLAALLLLYNLQDVVGFCTAATDDLLRERIGHPNHFSHLPSATAELLQRMDQQLWLHRNTFTLEYWGPSRWGLQLGASCAALLLSFWALIAAARPVEAIFGFLLLLLSLLLPLLQLEADYVGAIHLMVYPGAILIFFSFATLTTDQQGHWGEASGSGGLGHRLLTRLSALLVALPLLLLWWRQLAGRVGFSLQSRASQPTALELASEDLLPTELLRSSDLVALGLEIFQRRLLSLTLLGLLLLLAFLTALELLAPQRRRRSSSLFPRLGAFLFIVTTEDGG